MGFGAVAAGGVEAAAGGTAAVAGGVVFFCTVEAARKVSSPSLIDVGMAATAAVAAAGVLPVEVLLALVFGGGESEVSSFKVAPIVLLPEAGTLSRVEGEGVVGDDELAGVVLEFWTLLLSWMRFLSTAAHALSLSLKVCLAAASGK